MPRHSLTVLAGLSLLLAGIGCSATAHSQAPAAQSESVSVAAIRNVGKHKGDYLPAHNFKLEIDGVIVGGFKSLSGLEAEIEVIEYRDGDDPITHKRAGKAKYKNIVLKRGFVADPSLSEWYEKVLAGTTDRKSGSVIFLDRESNEVVRMTFECSPALVKADGLVYDVNIVHELVLAVENVAFKTKHDTAKNSVGNIR